MPRVRKALARKPMQPPGDTLYRAATVAAALLMLATVASL